MKFLFSLLLVVADIGQIIVDGAFNPDCTRSLQRRGLSIVQRLLKDGFITVAP